MVKQYNKSVHDIFGIKAPKTGEVGIEIEVEGAHLIQRDSELLHPFWVFHEDHSLRGESAEYVLKTPIPRQSVDGALDQLFKGLKGYGSILRKDSPNTSVHVHLNVSKWLLKKVYNFITLWYILEQTLTDWCGDDRVGNVFCLRGCDAEVQLQRLAGAIRFGRFNDITDQEGLRYSALNFTALGKFGSLEFRPLSGTHDPVIISKWVRMLCCIKDYAQEFDNPSEVMGEFSKQGSPLAFLKKVLKDDLWREVLTEETETQLRDGMRLAQHMAFCVNWERDEDIKYTKEDKKSKKFFYAGIEDDEDAPEPRREPPITARQVLEGQPVWRWVAPNPVRINAVDWPVANFPEHRLQQNQDIELVNPNMINMIPN